MSFICYAPQRHGWLLGQIQKVLGCGDLAKNKYRECGIVLMIRKPEDLGKKLVPFLLEPWLQYVRSQPAAAAADAADGEPPGLLSQLS